MGQTVREKALIRQAREDGRPSEDDVAQERLGWRGQKGRPGSAPTSQEAKLQPAPPLPPGHRAETRGSRAAVPSPRRGTEVDRQRGCGCATARERPTRKKTPAEGGAQVLGRTSSEGRRA